MKCTHIVAVLAAGCIVTSGAFGADVITYDSADRWTYVYCPDGAMYDEAVAFEPFDGHCQFRDPMSLWHQGVLASQASTLGPKSFSAEGVAFSDTAEGSFWFADADSYFDVTLTIDETSAFSLSGMLHGRGHYILSGPGLDLEGGFDTFDGGVDFCERHITGPGSYRFKLYVWANTNGPELINSAFELDFQLEPARAADVAGPDGPGHWDGRVDALDLLLVIAEWGNPCAPCHADITGPAGEPDGVVDVLDFLMVIGNWG